jgi:carbon-monoxide dehydrogenase medium subunit
MYISDYNYFRPKSLQEALSVLQKSADGVAVAGGTDLWVEIKNGIRSHADIVSLIDVKELKLLDENESTISIGAAVTHSELISSPLINKYLPALSDAATKIGSEQIRNMGTVGGNICTAAACCDTAPILIALDASVVIVNSVQTKTLPLKDFFLYNKKTILQKGDLVTKIIVPKPVTGTGAHYEKFGLREAVSISVVSAAVMLKLKGNTIEKASVVIGAVAPTPKISIRCSEMLTGKNIAGIYDKSPLLINAGEAAVSDSIPIDDIRGGAQYRRDVLNVITQRAIIKALENARLNNQ